MPKGNNQETIRIACIDIGTNAVLLQIADINKCGKLSPLHFEQRLPRIGKDISSSKVIKPEPIEKLNEIIGEYKNISFQFNVDKVIACATSAFREAKNQKEITEYVKSRTNIEIEVLKPNEEAYYTYLGVISEYPFKHKNNIVIDIGGGSTEIIYPSRDSKNSSFQKIQPNLIWNSYQLGAVILTEQYLKSNPPTENEIESTKKFIHDTFKKQNNSYFDNYQLIGVAGTVTTLACLNQALNEFELSKISGHKMTKERVTQWSRALMLFTNEDIRLLSDTTEGRSDILRTGVFILSEFMSIYNFNEIFVSEKGLRYGIIYREGERYFKD